VHIQMIHTWTRKQTAEDKTVAVTLNEYLEYSWRMWGWKNILREHKMHHRVYSTICVYGIDSSFIRHILWAILYQRNNKSWMMMQITRLYALGVYHTPLTQKHRFDTPILCLKYIVMHQMNNSYCIEII
jgi:hypothetical protein